MTATQMPGGAVEHPAAPPVLTIRVLGTPAPQGSKRAFRNKHTGRIQQVESSERVKPWREAVKWAARQAMEMPDLVLAHNANVALFDCPVEVAVTFTMPRPKGHYRTGRNAHLLRDAAPLFPAGTPDLDKTVRSTFDGLGEAGVWRDDAQVVYVSAWKIYESARYGLPGAHITVREATP